MDSIIHQVYSAIAACISPKPISRKEIDCRIAIHEYNKENAISYMIKVAEYSYNNLQN